jgi:phage-related protein/predicted XRE-type DNA-binding protein
VSDKALQWLGSARRDIRAFPREARRLAGFQLRRVQQGLDPLDWKPMPAVGPSVREIRIHTALEHRILYVAKFADTVYVLHAFEKRTRRTAQRVWSSPGSDTERCFANGRDEIRREANVPKEVRVIASTGNVFRDLGFRREEAEHLLVRADLMIQVQKLIAERRLKQRKAAEILRVSQPRVSDLLRGRIDLFSTDALIDVLARLGVRVRLTVKPTRRRLKVA